MCRFLGLEPISISLSVRLRMATTLLLVSSSFSNPFPVDTIKIDKSFVHGLPTDSADTAIIEAIFVLAKSLKLEVVAEGVETEQQFDFIKSKKLYKSTRVFV